MKVFYICDVCSRTLNIKKDTIVCNAFAFESLCTNCYEEEIKQFRFADYRDDLFPDDKQK